MSYSDRTRVFPRLLDLEYPEVDRGDGLRLYTTDGREILDACSGGAMIACLGHGARPVIDAAYEQGRQITYVYNHHFTNEPQERLADRLIAEVAPEMARVRFASGGSEANEGALRLIRQYHVDRGDEQRWRVISPSQAYHGATMGTLALSGRRALHDVYGEYLSSGHLHIPPARRDDPDGAHALAALDRAIESAGPETIAAFFCEPVSGAALPAYTPPDEFWRGLSQRAERHGFLVCFDEVVTGMGRTGSWFAYQDLPIQPDIVTAGKGMGAGYIPLAAVFCRQHVYDAIDSGSRLFDHGHTWDGAPLSMAVGLAVVDEIERQGLVERVRDKGPALLADLRTALEGSAIAGEVRGRGFLLGVSLVDPRDGESLLPHELDTGSLVDDVAFEHGVLVSSTHSTPDGFTGDEVLLAPAYTATDEELGQIVERVAGALAAVEATVTERLASAAAVGG